MKEESSVITRTSPKFCNILIVRVNLLHIFYVTKAIQVVIGNHGSYYTDTLCISLFRVWFESDEWATWSNSGSCALWVRIGPKCHTSNHKHLLCEKWLKKFLSGCKDLENQVRPCRTKTMDSKVMLQTIQANPVSCTLRVSGELGILTVHYGSSSSRP